jgi:hypothetical protein
MGSGSATSLPATTDQSERCEGDTWSSPASRAATPAVSDISPELVGSVFSGLVLLVGALATYTASRSRRVGEDARSLRRDLRALQKRYVAALQHIFHMETTLADRGLAVPVRPAELEADDDDPPVAPTPRLPPPPAPAPGGSHGG